MFKTILIANRGEIACRVMRTARRLGIRCIAVYSDADRAALHVAEADEAYRIGPAPAAESYLRIDAIVAAALCAKAEAIHPGYGFLSEKAEFAEACQAAGLVFIGPPAAAMRTMGLKDTAKQLIEKAGVPVVPGYHGGVEDPAFLAGKAREIGYPILVKAIAGGGGKGMRRVDDPGGLAAALETASREAIASFGDGRILIEKFIAKARHIEIQIFADAHGNAVSLFERDCSLQRRHQKIIEEAPAPGVAQDMRRAMGEAAVQAVRAVDYRGAGTVEFIADVSNGLNAKRFYFLEMNTRLQVEHPVTEAITGLDLVEWQLRVAAGEPLPLRQDQLAITGHAFEARICAEDPQRQFLPSTGRLSHLHFPAGSRVDSGVREGDEITPSYDSLMAKLIVYGPDRATALTKLAAALGECRVVGCATNIAFLKSLCGHPGVVSGHVDTGLVEREVDTLAHAVEPSVDAVAIAALSTSGFLEPPEDAANPWMVLRGWRAWGDARCYFNLIWRDQAIEGHVLPLGGHSFRIEWPGQAVACTCVSLDGEPLRVEIGDRSIGATVVKAGRRIDIFANGENSVFTIPAVAAGGQEPSLASDRIVSPITGLVKAVICAPGERVAKGHGLVVIEAMKLEHTVVAGRDGTLSALHVKAGDQVTEGTELLRFASDAAGPGAKHG